MKYGKQEFVLQALIVLLAASSMLVILPNHIFGDGLKMISANKSLDAYSLKYWFYIFTNPIHAGVQYRPFSIFVYPFIIRELFGLNIYVFHAFTIGIYTGISLLLYKFLRNTFKESLVAFIGVCFFIYHPGIVNLVDEMSHQAKYLVPLFILVYSLYRLSYLDKLDKKESLVQLILCTFSIMFHEGSLTFAYVLLLYAFVFNKLTNRSWIVIIPSLIYLVIRVFVFSIPETGMMEVNFFDLPKVLAYFLKALFTVHVYYNKFLIPKEGLVWLLGYLPALIIITYSLIKKKAHPLTFPIISIYFILAPFSAISNHYISSRVAWAVIFQSILLSYFFAWLVRFSKNKALLPITSVVLVLLGTSIFIRLSNTNIFRSHQKSFAQSCEYFKARLPAREFKNNEIISIYPSPELRYEWFQDLLLPGSLSLCFPSKTFLWSYDDRIVYIKGGSYYSKTLKEKVFTDPYGYEYPESTFNSDTRLDNISKNHELSPKGTK